MQSEHDGNVLDEWISQVFELRKVIGDAELVLCLYHIGCPFFPDPYADDTGKGIA